MCASETEEIYVCLEPARPDHTCVVVRNCTTMLISVHFYLTRMCQAASESVASIRLNSVVHISELILAAAAAAAAAAEGVAL